MLRLTTTYKNMTDSHSPDFSENLKQQLQALVPAAFKDGQLDYEALQQLLGIAVAPRDERYSLNWAGKADSYKVLQYPTSATLKPRVDQSVDFEHAQHVFIEGENLEVLKTLQRSYFGKVKMIYIDPPYNTGSDSFIYPDRFQESREDYLKRIESLDIDGIITKEGLFRKNSKDNGHYHSNWLSMMLPRLYLARNLLCGDGVIFIQIDDNEQAQLKLLCDEVFGEENFISEICIKMSHLSGVKMSHKDKRIPKIKEFILVYAKQANSVNLAPIFVEGNWGDVLDRYDYFVEKNGKDCKKWTVKNLNVHLRSLQIEDDKEIDKFKLENAHSIFRTATNSAFEELARNEFFEKITTTTGLEKFIYKGEEVLFASNKLKVIDGKKVPVNLLGDIWTDIGINNLHNEGGVPFPNGKKPLKLITRVIDMCVNNDEKSIIVDFFAGSGTIAQAVMDLNHQDGGNRQYVCVQMPEPTDEASEAYKAGYKTIADISRERIRRVIERIKKNADLASPVKESDTNLGFRAFELAPSNFKQWRGDWAETPEELDKQLALMLPTEKRGATSLDMVFELLLKNGRPLVSQVELKTIIQTPVHIVWSQDAEAAENTVALMFVLESIQLEALPAILALKPKHVVFLDSVFNNNDSVKVNVALQCESAGVKFSSI